MSKSLGSMAITANTKTTFDAPSDGVKGILIGNESGLTVTITMESGGVQKTLYPSTVDWFTVNRGFTGKVLINPTVILSNVSSWPSSSLVFDAIGLNDIESAAQYPIMLPRNTNIGNTLLTTNTNSSLVNTTSAPLTNVISVQPTDAASNTITVDNSGNVTINSDNAGVLTTLLQLIAGASPAVKIAAASIIAEMLGGLKVDGTSTLTGAVTAPAANILGTAGNTQSILGQLTMSHEIIMPNNVAVEGKDSGGTAQVMLNMNTDNSLRVASGAGNASIFFTDSTNTTLVSIVSGSLNAPNGINYNVGRIKDINNGSALSGTINHGLSGTPAAVLATCDTVSSSATVGASSYTSTQFGLTIGGGLNGRWLAYR